jgi:hypothetical protein
MKCCDIEKLPKNGEMSTHKKLFFHIALQCDVSDAQITLKKTVEVMA